MKRWEALARREVVQTVTEPTPVMLLSTARTMTLLRISARNASYHALRTMSSRKASAAPAYHEPASRIAFPNMQALMPIMNLDHATVQQSLSACKPLKGHGSRGRGSPREIVGTMSVLLMMVET